MIVICGNGHRIWAHGAMEKCANGLIGKGYIASHAHCPSTSVYFRCKLYSMLTVPIIFQFYFLCQQYASFTCKMSNKPMLYN